MCGIVYSENFDGSPVNNAVLQQFDKQRSRGTEGFGVFDGIRQHLVHETKEKKILKWLVNHDSPLLLMHHRFPTSTINVRQASHPFSTKAYFGDTQYILVHNGHITNDDELYVEHQERGIKYHSLLPDLTFNDSEALLWDLALTLEGKQDKLTAYGGTAFICLKLVKGKLDKMYFGRNYNPLILQRTKEGISLSSEGEGEAINPQTLYTWNYALKRLTKKTFQIPTYAPNAGPYAYTGAYAGNYSRPRYDTYGGYDDDDDRYVQDAVQKQFGGYEWDDDKQLHLPSGVVKQKAFGGYMTEDEEYFLEMGGELPTKEEIQRNLLAYLAGSSGVFEGAYWQLELDYDELEALPFTFDTVEEMILTSRTIDMLLDDPEYKTKKSVSALWKDLDVQTA